MHPVIATSIVPHGEPANGNEIANAGIIDALRRAGVCVTVPGFTWPGKAPAVLGSFDMRTDNVSILLGLATLGYRHERACA
jgi:hypothetical protein